ncbi:purine-nucleoside phosphorylase [Bacteroidales bacterium OttesenSCG-928-B11]|nr:purine-nucleoside phosphorylase [Bacteroidales bacterium OttesenSCG-928-B11]MDL2325737.1 purine-nucleoside phosphorylase [Bacteroidales bacterium OttesenSCG-928-A14]
MLERIQKIADFLNSKKVGNPKIAIVLGSGLGNLGKIVEKHVEIPYKEIPGYPVSTVAGHAGTWIYGRLNGVDLVVLNGRFHYYEGYDMKEVTLPIQVLKEIGIEKVILSNAAGGMNPTFKVGDVMIINDHINLFGDNPLLGKNDDKLGPRFLDMSEAYSRNMRKVAFKVAKEHGLHVQEGVYMGVSGPCYETPAEYRMFHIMGADAVGMSTVPETIVARYRGMEVFAFSVITDLGIVGRVENVSHEEVLKAAETAAPVMEKLVIEMLPQL